MTDLSQALAFWFGRINYEQRSPLPSDLRLDRMVMLLGLLGKPHRDLPIVHVAGSKGKGSTSAMLASILVQAGYRTGLFTSPHLTRVEERIQVDHAPISAENLISLLGEVRQAVQFLDRKAHPDVGPVTFFEVATALGFLHFAQEKVDAAVVEVGLGGRFDSTNVCQPLVALITSISLDHTAQLGDRLSQIAMEKAGIVKPGRPAISGARGPEARSTIEKICRKRKSPLRQIDREIHYRHLPGRITAETVSLPRIQVTTDRRSWPEMELGLLGEHQAENAAVALAAVEHLADAGFQFGDRAVAAGLAEVIWPARLEVLARRPMVVLDCAHNVASAQALMDTLRASFPAHMLDAGPSPQRVCTSSPPSDAPGRHLIFAGSSDKDLATMLHILAPRFTHLYLSRYSHSQRGVPPDQLAAVLPRLDGVSISTHPDPKSAWQAAFRSAASGDLLCITGSVFLAGELRPLLLENLKKGMGEG